MEGSTIDTGTVLAGLRRAQAEVRSAEVEVLVQALEWARLHEVEPGCDDAATWKDAPVLLAGEGAPAVNEFCLAEFGAALGMTTDAGRRYLSHALELGHRLPAVFARVLDGTLPVWRARRIAEATQGLSPEAAAFVDATIAPDAHQVGITATDRLVDRAIATFMPALAEEIARKAEDARRVVIDTDHPSYAGTARLYGEIDLTDAYDLEDALARGAEQLKEEGCTLSLDARRTLALGVLARGELKPSNRELVIHLHVDADDATTGTLENSSGLLTLDTIRSWAGDATDVTVKPVIDLNAELESTGYQPSDPLREQVVLRDKTCVFAHCTKKARKADLDHIRQYRFDGTPGQTTTNTLACLCRSHHRLKTHGGWTYRRIGPGTYLWTSPHGYRYLRDPTGTTDVTRQLVELRTREPAVDCDLTGA